MPAAGVRPAVAAIERGFGLQGVDARAPEPERLRAAEGLASPGSDGAAGASGGSTLTPRAPPEGGVAGTGGSTGSGGFP